MDLQEIYEKILKTTPFDESEIYLGDFEGLSVSQIWKKIDGFLKDFDLELYCISSLDPTQKIHFESYHTPSNNFEYIILGLRKLNTEDIVLFSDITYTIKRCDMACSMTRMLVDFYKRVTILKTFPELEPKFYFCGKEVQGWGYAELYKAQQEDMI